MSSTSWILLSIVFSIAACTKFLPLIGQSLPTGTAPKS
jgi:hypothetical protein